MPFIEGFFGFFGGKWYKSVYLGPPHTKYIDFTALNLEFDEKKKILFGNTYTTVITRTV
jgi:hypothetical protein